MANSTPVARVSAIQGQAFAKGKDGELRALRVGDPVFEGDVVVTADGSRVDLAGADGRTLVVRANETLSVDAEVAGSVKPDAADSSIQVATADVNKVIKAINQGGSLDELLEETAAGDSAGGADGGPSFVRLLRIAEGVAPLNFEFDTARPGGVDEFVFGGGNIQDLAQAASVVAAELVFAVSGQAMVNERGLTSLADSSETSSGTITVTAPGGLSSVTVAGVAFTAAQLSALAATPQAINTGTGTLTLTGYNAASGALAYTYTLNAAQNQPGATESVDSIALSVTGPEGEATGTLTIQIVDSVPLAVNDSKEITEDALSNTVSGSVLTNDDVGADANATPVTATAGTINLAYGSLLLNSDGSYTYTLNNANPAVNALKTGQSLTDSYTYTLTDGDGDTTTAQLNITINGNTDGPPSIVPVDGNGVLAGQATVNEQGLTSAGDTSETTSGTIIVSAPDGLSSVTIGGIVFTATQLATPAYLAANPINTGAGTLTLTGFDAGTGALSYSYTLNAAQNQPGVAESAENIALSVTDLGGESTTGTLTISILDTAPLAIVDVNAISEDAAPSSVGGNVITTGAGSDTLGADATTVTGVVLGTPASASGNVGSSVNGTYGTLVLGTDGSYIYTLNNANPAVNALKTGQSLTETYTYTITDADGDASTATLTITINGNTDAVPSIVPIDGNGGAAGQATVNEQGLTSAGDTSETTTGTITVSAPDGLQSVVIGGVTFTAAQLASPAYLAANTINTGTGTLTLTGYDPLSGAISYTYTLNGPVNQPGATASTDSIALTVNDLGGDSNTGTLTINILDTAPLAIADVNAITEDAAPNSVGGNVISTGAGSDTLGADATTVTGVAAGTLASASGNVGSSVNGTYGTLVLGANGSYTYTLNNANPAVQALNAGETTTDTFTYTLTDADGDASSTTLTITQTGSNDLVTVTVPDANGATPGDLSVREDQTTTGSFTISAPDGLDPVAAVTIAGTAISKAALEGSGTTNVTITTPQGVLTVTGYDPLTGIVSYSYDPSGTAKNHTGGDVLDAISIVVKDDSGDTSSSTLTINILDTAPLAIADVNAITEDAAPNSVGGNVISTGAGADTLGADATAVTGIIVGAGVPGSNVAPGTTSANGTSVTGTYGTLVLGANGSYTYTLNNANQAVQAIARNQTATDTFTYTITDADGDASTATLTVTVTGSNDAPDITVGVGDSAAVGLLETNSGLAASSTLSIFDVDTLDTVTPSVTAVTTGGTYTGLASLPLTSAQLLAMFSVSGGELSTTLQSAPNGIGWNFNSGSQAFNFIPAGQTLVLTYNVRATDTNSAVDNQPVTITITGTNDGVVINDDTRTFAENASAAGRSGNVLTNDILDPDFGATTRVTGFSIDANGDGTPENYLPGASVTVKSAFGGTLGVLTMSNTGAYSFTPQAANFSGAVPLITYTAGSASDSGSATLAITVTPVSDAPGVTRDAATVITPEDTAVALGFNAPTVTDAIDQTGPATGDNPERLGLISLTGIPRGATLQDALGNNLYTIPATGSATVTIRLSDAANLITSPGAATLTMTTAQFEALRVLPVAHSATNFTVTMSVTSFEVNDAGTQLSGVAGATSTLGVAVDVRAVTDPIDLRIAGGNAPHNVTINEDASLNLTSLLSATFQDLDGSERRDIIIANPAGNGTIFVNGNAVAAGSSFTIAWNAAGNNLETSQAGFPAISITTGANFSGDLNGITVTLSARDNDTDSPAATPATLTDSVVLNLHVNPVAGDVTIAPVSTPEDTGVRFLNALALTDTDGSESITGITINTVPAGWVIRDDTGVVVFTGNGAAAYSVPAGEVTNGDFRNYTVTPAAHSSADRTLAIAVQTSDTRTVNGAPVTSTVTTNLSQTITVSAVAEIVGADSNADGTPDLTINPDFNYTTPGKEDQWFTLNQDGFNFKAPWSNQDADEKTFALLTPVLSGGSAIGSQFQYTVGGVTTMLTYTGSALQIPMGALDTVQFKAAPNVAGSFQIQVQALTIDTDPNTGISVQAISGTATLTNLVIAPVADPVTLAVDAPAVGLEDTAIPLVIRATSADPSETFIVTLNGIPPGAKIVYGGVELTVTGGSVSIANFSSSTPLTLTPPLNSNVDIPLSVSAVSVDTSGGLTDTSGATTLPLVIDVRGVADPVALTVQSPLQTTEALVDGGGRRIALSGVITAVTPGDSDGSESVNVVLSGVPAGFNIEGLTFMGGVGSGRLWSGTPAQVAAASLLVRDDHYSGTISFNVRAVSTENDGNSLSGSPVPVSIQVLPSPEAVLVTQTTVLEDTLTPVNFALQLPNVDGNETLHSLWIDATNLASKPFTLYLGATPLAAALVADAGWYKLTAAQAANVFAKGSANSDADGSFAIKYEIRDTSNDGSLPATISQFDASHTLTVAAVTDATVSTNDYSGGVVGATTTLAVKVSVTQQDDANAGGAKDVDGSERLLYFIIDNVPIGITVEGGSYIGNTPGNPNTGRWILDMPDTPEMHFTATTLHQTIRFALNGTSAQLSSLNQQIAITAHTQDTGDVERTSTTTWTLQTAANFNDSGGGSGGIPAATIMQWVPDPLSVALNEDAPTPLTALVDAQIGGSSPFAVTLTGLPPGSVVAGMLLTVVAGQNVWTAQGNGDNASLQALLAGISITPPPNWNANQGPFGFSTTLTTYDAGGTRNDASFSVGPSVTPVSDPIVLTASDADVLEDSTAGISLTLANPADGVNSQVVGGKVYIRLDESAMESAGGSLSFAGSVVAPTAVSGVPGVPDGNYYVLTGVGSSANLALAYQPAANASGVVAYTAYVQGQETGAGNVTTTSVTGSFAVNPVDDGVALAVLPATGVEDQRIPLSIAATLNDAGEVISSLTLTNVPDGFLVFSGMGGPGTKAINLGSGVWGIPLVGGAIPSYVALQPPINWSGTLSNLQVGVWSGERDLDPVLTTSNLDVTVNGDADGITLTPTLSFGNEGKIVALNLNSVMPDSDGSETATLTFKGLGEHAAFYAGSSLLAATYDTGSDTYSLSSLTPAQVTGLGVIQKDGVYNLEVTAHTTDSPGVDSSALVSATLSLSIAPVIATTGNDTLLYDGGPLNGLLGVDTIELRLGENLDFSLSPVKPTNIERFDLMPAGQNHSLNHLMLQDVLDMSGSGKTLTILGDSGDSVGLKDGSGLNKWTNTGTETSDGHVFDIYTNAFDSAVKVLIEQQVNRHIDP